VLASHPRAPHISDHHRPSCIQLAHRCAWSLYLGRVVADSSSTVLSRGRARRWMPTCHSYIAKHGVNECHRSAHRCSQTGVSHHLKSCCKIYGSVSYARGFFVSLSSILNHVTWDAHFLFNCMGSPLAHCEGRAITLLPTIGQLPASPALRLAVHRDFCIGTKPRRRATSACTGLPARPSREVTTAATVTRVWLSLVLLSQPEAHDNNSPCSFCDVLL
jgi:hypothetical protein